MDDIQVKADTGKRSLGITIFSVTEIILGVAGIIAATVCLFKTLMLYEPATTNASVGFGFVFTAMLYLLGLPLFIGGILMFLLKPAGRITTICCMILLLPLSIFFILYLLRKDVTGQFTK